jgi:hypothetical protein
MGGVVTAVRFEVYELGDDYWFRLNGQECGALLFSGPQDDLAECLERLTELKTHCHEGAWFRARLSPGGAHYFTIEVGAEILATSNLYRERRERDVRMAFVRAQLVDAPVVMRGVESISRDDSNHGTLDEPAIELDAASSGRW